MRAVGIDLGTVRIGVAVSDAGGVLASPLTTVLRSGDRAGDHRRIAAVVSQEEAGLVVVGLPISLDGHDGPAAVAARAEAAELAELLSVPVVLHDERLSTVTAQRMLRERGLDGRARRKVVDQVAAAVVLQDWIDARAGATRREGEA